MGSVPNVEWVKPKLAAKYLGVRRKQLKTWRRDGGGPIFERRGSEVLYRTTDLVFFVRMRQADTAIGH